MIELRWLEIQSAKGHVHSPWLVENKERYVLQYRTRVMKIDSDDQPFQAWSEWQDVPVEREGA